MEHSVTSNSILIDEQCGFKLGYYATINLIIFNTLILDVIKNNNEMNNISLLMNNFAKA